MPVEPLTIVLPYPPSVNHYKKIGRTIKTASGKMYQQRVNSDKTRIYFYQVWMKAVQMSRQGDNGFRDATISVEVDVFPADKRKRDLDGILKVLLDALQHAGVYNDDNQIARLLVTRRSMISGGEIVVRINEM